MKRPKLIDGLPTVKRESDAAAVYDSDAREFVAFASGTPWLLGGSLVADSWSIGKSKALRERATGHRCYFVGWPEVQA